MGGVDAGWEPLPHEGREVLQPPGAAPLLLLLLLMMMTDDDGDDGDDGGGGGGDGDGDGDGNASSPLAPFSTLSTPSSSHCS